MMKKSEEKKRKVGSLVLVRMKRVKMEKGGLCIHVDQNLTAHTNSRNGILCIIMSYEDDDVSVTVSFSDNPNVAAENILK